MHCSISSILFIICKQRSACLDCIIIIGLDIIQRVSFKSCVLYSGMKQLGLFLLPLPRPWIGMLVGSITSRCSGKEPAFLPRRQKQENSRNQAQAASPSKGYSPVPICTPGRTTSFSGPFSSQGKRSWERGCWTERGIVRVKCLVHKHSTMDVPSQTASISVHKKYLLCHHHMSFKLSAEYFAFFVIQLQQSTLYHKDIHRLSLRLQVISA